MDNFYVGMWESFNREEGLNIGDVVMYDTYDGIEVRAVEIIEISKDGEAYKDENKVYIPTGQVLAIKKADKSNDSSCN